MLMAQRGTYLACQTDGCGFVMVLESPGEIPTCPKCQQGSWRTMDPPLRLTENDKRFLRSLRITPED